MKKPTSEVRRTAVALCYDGNGAPRVTAKGYGLICDEIRKTAIENDIPMQQDAGLAQALACIPLAEEIPHELYTVVAEVLSFIYSLNDEVSR